MKKGKKALTLLLIFTLALSLFPQSAQAAKKKKVKLNLKMFRSAIQMQRKIC